MSPGAAGERQRPVPRSALPPPARRGMGSGPSRPPTPSELLGFADEVLSAPSASLEGRWPVAAALLIRQALERVLVELWRTVMPGVEATSLTVQLLCLRSAIEPSLARRVAYTWSALSRASHHHAYELPPTAGELATWFDTTEELTREVALRIAAAAARPTMARDA